MSLPRLHVFTARFNPLRYAVPDQHYRDWVGHVLDSGADLTVAEVQYGQRPFVADLPDVNHIGLRADSWAWSKENAINLAIARTPDAEFIAWGDSDIWHRRSDWAREAVEMLQHHRVGQTWDTALDLGPGSSLLQTHRSFCHQYVHGFPLTGKDSIWKWSKGPYDYPHPGFFWACKRELLDRTGGLFDLGGMGSGDHHMALSMVDKTEASMPIAITSPYGQHLSRWGQRARAFVNGRIGYVPGMVEHRFHGAKANRGYLSRWDIFIRHAFNPDTDLKRNSLGVLEWAGNKPELEREWECYLRARREDDNNV